MGNLGFIELLPFILVIVFTLLALIDILKSDFKESVNKIVWVLVVIFLPLLGAILYFIIGSAQKRL